MFDHVGRADRGVSKAHMFYTGTCDGGSAAQVNVALHLLLNVVSTAIFASSNFFMQVLNSPSRKEVDEIHSKGPWMGIGVSSVRNTFGVSKFKTSCWILLLVPSIPLHLLFNSIIFQTDQRSSDFQLTIASEGFVNAASFYPPGASLTPSGSLATALWGADVDLLQYNDSTSIAYRNISAIAREGNSWRTRSVQDCYNEYYACEGLRSHRSVIIVAEQTQEWVRDELWNCTGYATYPKKSGDDPWTIDFFNVALDYVNHTYHDHYSDLNYNNLTYGLIPDGSSLTVSYCLAEPVDQVCQVGLSTTLLLAGTLCVFVKTATAIVVMLVLGRRGQAPLVTLGDAVASFIERPDSATFGMCMVGQQDIRIALSSLTQGHPGWAQEVAQKAVPSLRDSAIISLVVHAVQDRGWFGQFLESDTNSFISDIPWRFAPAVLLANSPQLLLSFCYLAYVLCIPLTEPAPPKAATYHQA
ncbi:hypothetical protein AB5N19_08990 [Seiridium cardinale]